MGIIWDGKGFRMKWGNFGSCNYLERSLLKGPLVTVGQSPVQ